MVPMTAVCEFPARAWPKIMVSFEFRKWCVWLPSRPPFAPAAPLPPGAPLPPETVALPAPPAPPPPCASARTQRARWKSERLMSVSSLNRSFRHCVRRSCSRPAKSTRVRLLLDESRSMRSVKTACDLDDRSFNAVAAVVRARAPSMTRRRASCKSVHGISSTSETKEPNRGWKCTFGLRPWLSRALPLPAPRPPPRLAPDAKIPEQPIDMARCPPLPPSCHATISDACCTPAACVTSLSKSRTRSLWIS
mmetsp:Transcript_56311/g.146784  ORF Transcript_56311/g.146784 Transcript_56311/m.146784 type:complete len:250 (+) Transcript_56311:160-909(+)